MSRSSNQKRKRKARLATGVPCESGMRAGLRLLREIFDFDSFQSDSAEALLGVMADLRARGVPYRFDSATNSVTYDARLTAERPGFSAVLTGAN